MWQVMGTFSEKGERKIRKESDRAYNNALNYRLWEYSKIDSNSFAFSCQFIHQDASDRI